MVSNFPVTPGTSYTINVGAGGSNGSSTNGMQVPGGDSWISASTNVPTNGCVAKGGAGGGSAVGNSGTTANGLAGIATSSGCIGNVIYSGGSGSAGSSASKYAGAGGSGAGSSSAGTSAITTNGGIAPSGGGNGGNGTTVTGGGNSGFAPGGGGGGARSGNGTLYAGGSGASGKVLITVQSLASVTQAAFSLSNTNQTYTGNACPVTVVSSPTNAGPVSVTYSNQVLSPTTNPPTNAGIYTVFANISSTNYSGSATTTLTINPASASISLSNTSQPYNGFGRFVSITTDPSGLANSVTYNGSSNLPIGAGTYSLAATIMDPNYSGSASGSFVIYDALASWRSNYYGTVNNAGNAADASSPNGIGINNIQAYTFGVDPTLPLTGPLLSISKTGSNALALSFLARAAGSGPGYSGLTRYYNLEASTTPTNSNAWNSVPGYSNIPGSNQVISFSTNTLNGIKWFYRLKVWLQ